MSPTSTKANRRMLRNPNIICSVLHGSLCLFFACRFSTLVTNAEKSRYHALLCDLYTTKIYFERIHYYNRNEVLCELMLWKCEYCPLHLCCVLSLKVFSCNEYQLLLMLALGKARTTGVYVAHCGFMSSLCLVKLEQLVFFML